MTRTGSTIAAADANNVSNMTLVKWRVDITNTGKPVRSRARYSAPFSFPRALAEVTIARHDGPGRFNNITRAVNNDQ